VTGNLEKEAETLRLWAQTYPRDALAPGLAGGYASAGTGNYELMIQTSRDAIALDAAMTPPYFGVVGGLLSLARVNDAKQALGPATDHAPTVPEVLVPTLSNCVSRK
jgi:hypothetical protein